MSEPENTDKGALATLEAATRELNAIRDALDESAIVAITDRKGDITHVNKKFCDISKYPSSELMGRNHRVINSGYHPKDFFVEMWRTISRGSKWEGEIKNRAKDGTYYWVYTTIVPFVDERGKPYQYVSIRYDITQRKFAEEKIKTYAKRLEESNRELQDFASIAAHDLQEPLRKVQTFSDRLKTKYAAVLDDSGRDYIERMLDSTRRMRRLIDDLLTYSRVTTRAQPFVPVSLNQVMKEVVADLEVRVEQTGARLEIGDLPTVDADPSQLHQLFLNLLGNALKFQTQGTAPAVRVHARVLGTFNDLCEISVADNGIGFDEKYLDRIFTIFQRLHGRQEYEGTGVGLAVCRRIVERHGGAITAKSTPGQGATFLVTLPVRQGH